MTERGRYIETGGKRESILSCEFVGGVQTLAKENFRRDGYIAPVLFFQFFLDERIAIPLDLPKAIEEREAYFAAIGLATRRLGKSIYEALVVSKVWYFTNEDEGFALSPSQYPKRKEALQIIGRDYRGVRTTILLQPFFRDLENRHVFEPPRIEQYNLPIKTGIRPVGLLDYLFVPFPPNSGNGASGKIPGGEDR